MISDELPLVSAGYDDEDVVDNNSDSAMKSTRNSLSRDSVPPLETNAFAEMDGAAVESLHNDKGDDN